MTPDPDSPQVKIPPPLGVLAVALGSSLLRYFAPAPFVSETIQWTAGLSLIIGGLALIVWCAILFRKHSTDIKPWMPTLRIIREGPYLRSRNPIYFSFLIIATGVVFIANNLWAFLLLPMLYLFLQHYVITREESYLTKKFGSEYSRFQATVRRWL